MNCRSSINVTWLQAIALNSCTLLPGHKIETSVQHLDEDEAIGVYPTSMKEALDMIKKNMIVDAKTAVGLLLYNEFKKSVKANS